MKKLIGTLMLLLGFVSFCQAQTWEDVRDLTVLITNNQFGGTGAGTGVLLDPTHVLTCFHMVRSEKDDFLVYTYPMGKVIRAHVEGGNKADDLAVLTLAEPVKVKAPPVFENHYVVGEPITVVGNALGGMLWFVTKGVVSGISQGFLLTDALINPGNSGGPWVNANGDIVALTDWGIGPEEHVHGLSGGVSSVAINRMLDARAQQIDQQFLMKLLQGNR